MSHDLVRAAMTADDQLDDLKRARIWNSLDDRLAEPTPRRARWPFAAIAMAAAAAAILFVTIRRGDDATTLVVAADATLTSPIGPYTRSALVGPAELDVIGVPGESTTVRLRSGVFLADFAGGPGRALRVEAPGAVVDVIGTVFAVEARADETCVSVLHGRVRINQAIDLASSTFCTTTGHRTLSPAIRTALERHERIITAHAGPDRAPIAKPRDADLQSPPTDDARTDAASAVATVAPRTDQRTAPAVVTDAPRLGAPPVEQTAPVAAADERGPLPPTEDTKAAEPPPAATDDRVPPAPTEAPRVAMTADDLYRAAETALAAQDPQAADRALESLITNHPASPLVEQALYERARIAHHRRAWGLARQHLDRVLAIPSSRLAEPARYLTCRIAVETRDAAATACLVDYRKAYPRSPHDRDVLGLLVQLEVASGGCRAATPRIAELARVYPTSKLAVAWRARCPEAR